MNELKEWLKAFREAIVEVYQFWCWGLRQPLIGVFFFYALLFILLLVVVVVVEIYKRIVGL